MSSSTFISRELAAAVQDPSRVAAVRDTGLLDAPRIVSLDRLAQLAQHVLDTPTVLITLVDAERDYVVSGVGLPEVLSVSREIRFSPTFSQYAVATREAFLVTDAPNHPTFSTFPIVSDGGVIACANAPIITSGGMAIGNVCGIDYTRRVWPADTLDTLCTIADAVATEAELRITRRAAERSAHQALHDSLTGLANRTLFLDRLEHAVARASRGEHVAIMYVDLDDFKAINDRLGHFEGDALLQAVATRLRQATRTSDTVARLGGDEFAVLLEGMAAEYDAAAAAGRITAALRAPVVLHGRDVHVSAAIGIAHTQGSESVDELLKHADLAMYRAKRSGNGATAVFEPAMRAAMADRMQMSTDVANAIADNQLHLLYQPIIDLKSGVMRGVEALARWQHPTRGAVSPATFIPAAEEGGAIARIDRWVLHEAFAQLSRWDTEWRNRPLDQITHRRYGLPSIHVNISGRHLMDPALRPDVESALNASRLAPSRVVLEVGEETVLQKSDRLVEVLRGLKQLGVRIALDDFGTGCSSLQTLRQLPIDILKIDPSFVAAMTGGAHDGVLARSVVALGEALSLGLIAEGVELPEQRRELRTLGCDQAQGYLFSTPLSASQVVVWASSQLSQRGGFGFAGPGSEGPRRGVER